MARTFLVRPGVSHRGRSSRPQRIPAARPGLVISTALTALVSLGSILLLAWASWRVRDSQVRSWADEVVALYLARGAVQTLAYAVERDIDRPGEPPGFDLTGGTLREVLLGDVRTVEALVAGRAGGRPDHRELIEQLLGPRPFALIEEMAASQPGARFTYQLRLSPVPARSRGLLDPVEKTVDLGLSVRCRVRHGESTSHTDLRIIVASDLPRAAARFMVVWLGVRPAEASTLAVDPSGRAVGGPSPVVTFAHPSDYDPDDPLLGGSGGRRRAGSGPDPVGGLAGPPPLAQVTEGLEGRGACYVSGADPERPITLRVAAGDGPAGQDALLYGTRDGADEARRVRPLAGASPRLAGLGAVDARTGARQAAWIQGGVFGYYRGIDADGLLGPPPEGDDGGDGTGVLRPLGTPTSPSIGLVYGRVDAGVAAISGLAVDRDASPRDEAAQRGRAGIDLPVRDSIDPFLRHVDAGAYAADIERERRGEATLSLLPFASPGLPAGRVRNLHAAYEPDPADATIGLDPGSYRYGKIFGPYPEYSSRMSRRLGVPYNTLVRAAVARVPARDLLTQVAFAQDRVTVQGDHLTDARWRHSDPLHLQLEPSAGHRWYLDTTAEGADPLHRHVLGFASYPRHTSHVIQCKGERLFRESFLDGGRLDLGGTRVAVGPERRGQPMPHLDLGDVEVVPGGGGVLAAASVRLRSVRHTGDGSTFSPLVVVAQSLTLEGPGPFEGCYIVSGRLGLEGDARHALVRGLVFDQSGEALGRLTRPLAVVFDPRMDPTGPRAHLSYRAWMVAGAGPSISGGTGTVQDLSTHRRDESRRASGAHRLVR